MEKTVVVWIILLGSLLCFFSCQPSFVADSWEVTINNSGSSSSPKATDLNGDGILDIIIGSGAQEFKTTPYGVLALDGKDGSTIWQISTRNQIVGTPLLMDANGDDTQDVLIGGRSAELNLIDGKTGSIIWEYMQDDPDADLINDTLILNFFNAQLCPDIDGDDRQDIIVTYGGFIKAKPEITDRPQGYLMAISSMDGKELIRMPTSDGKEIYCSPVLTTIFDDQLSILFGTGGETIGGGFYAISFSDFATKQFNNITTIVNDETKGFIAPPTIVDMNNDSQMDLVINAVNGKIICIDGRDLSTLWTANIGAGYEGYAMSCPGYFYGDDDVKDIITSYGYGPWPDTEFTSNILIDGSDGSIVYKDSAGTFQYASPIAYDFDNDKIDDIVIATNHPISTKLPNTSHEVTFLGNDLSIHDFTKKQSTLIRPTKIGSNLGSTPLLTDIDNDGHLDIISCYMTDAKNFYSFSKMVIERIELKHKKQAPFNWNSYMGIATDAIDHPQ